MTQFVKQVFAAPHWGNTHQKEAHIMKVETAYEIIDPGRNAVSWKDDQTQKGRFGEILRETMDTSAGPTGEGQPASVTNPIEGIYFDPRLLQPESPVLDQTERLLDTLETYQQKLGDRQVELSQMDPLIADIKKQSEGLASKADTLPDGDPLREILNQTLIVSSLEVLKYSRGDYSAM